MTMTPAPATDIERARPLAIFGDSITTDHISPAGAIKPDSPAGRYLLEQQVSRGEFNSYGARRGNHEVMMRGTFANIRIRNRMLDNVEGGFTRYAPTGETMPIYDAAMLYKADGRPLVDRRRQGIWHRQLARLGGQGHGPARRPRGDRRELRAHPPLEPGRHGRAAAAVPRRRECRDLGLDGDGEIHDRRRRRAASRGRMSR